MTLIVTFKAALQKHRYNALVLCSQQWGHPRESWWTLMDRLVFPVVLKCLILPMLNGSHREGCQRLEYIRAMSWWYWLSVSDVSQPYLYRIPDVIKTPVYRRVWPVEPCWSHSEEQWSHVSRRWWYVLHGMSRLRPFCTRKMAVLVWLGLVEPRSTPV